MLNRGQKRAQIDMLESWVRQYATEFYRFSLLRLKNREDAEDVVQMTFLKAQGALSSFNPGSNARAWLYTILLNSIRDQVKRKGNVVKFVPIADDSVVETIADTGESPEEFTIKRSELEMVTTSLAKLPEHFVQPLILKDVNDLSYAEIAKLLAIPIGTVMSRLSRARKALSDALHARSQSRNIGRKENPDELQAH